MHHSKKPLLLLVTVLAYGLAVNANPITLDIDKELKAARTIAIGTIESYTDTSLFFRMSDTDNTKFFTAKLKPYRKSFIETEKTGGIPHVNSSVLIVIDSNNFVSLFAKVMLENSQFIFWSPVYNGSECLFIFNDNFKADTLTTAELMLINPCDQPAKFEKVNKSSGKVFISFTLFCFNYTFDTYETGRINIQGEDILFIPSFAFGKFYRIKNKSSFKELHGRKISAFGKLINYEFDIKEFKVID